MTFDDKLIEEFGRYYCRRCADRRIARGAEERFSLGVYAGMYCEACWDKSGYRQEGKEGYDYLDAGEYYDESEV